MRVRRAQGTNAAVMARTCDLRRAEALTAPIAVVEPFHRQGCERARVCVSVCLCVCVCVKNRGANRRLCLCRCLLQQSF